MPRKSLTRAREIEETVEEFIHPLAAQGNFYADYHALAELKVCNGFFRLAQNGFWPVIAETSATTASSTFGLSRASPQPTLMTILSSFGICMTLLYANFFTVQGLPH